MQRNYYSSTDELIDNFADYAVEILASTLKKREEISIVVPGGNTPRLYLPTLADRIKAQFFPWKRITITLSDERWINTDTEDSNEYLVKKYLLEHLPKAINFIGLKTAHASPSEALYEIQQRLKKISRPFALSVLGLGEDGHIASLFPGMTQKETDVATIDKHCIAAVKPPVAPSPRVSLSLAALAGSEQIILVVTGKKKRQLLDRITYDPEPRLPLVWLLRNSKSPINVFETD